MKIFLTGATGFVGGHLLKTLRAKGHEVRCLVRSGSKAWRIGETGASVVPGDISEKESLLAGMEGVDAVIHLVGIIQQTGNATFEKIHFEGARNVIEAASDLGVKRFVHMSALGVRPNARSRYHRTKFRAEEILKGSGLDYTIFRPSVIFGPGDGFVNLLADLVARAPVVPILGSGKNRLQPISVYDVAEFFSRSLDEPQALRRTFDLGGPEALEYQEMVALVMAAMGKKKMTIHLPLPLMTVPVFLMDKILPRPPINWDQFQMLGEANVCDMGSVLSIFPISLRKFQEGIREYLSKR